MATVGVIGLNEVSWALLHLTFFHLHSLLVNKGTSFTK